MATHLFLAEKVPDFDVILVAPDAGVDGEMGIHEPHLVPVALGHTGDQVVDVADGSADGGHGLAGAEPCIHLQLSAFIDHLEVQVEMLEVAGEHSSWPCNPNLLRLDFDLDPIREVHHLGCQNGLHGCDASASGAVRQKPTMHQASHAEKHKETFLRRLHPFTLASCACQRPSLPVATRQQPVSARRCLSLPVKSSIRWGFFDP